MSSNGNQQLRQASNLSADNPPSSSTAEETRIDCLPFRHLKPPTKFEKRQFPSKMGRPDSSVTKDKDVLACTSDEQRKQTSSKLDSGSTMMALEEHDERRNNNEIDKKRTPVGGHSENKKASLDNAAKKSKIHGSDMPEEEHEEQENEQQLTGRNIDSSDCQHITEEPTENDVIVQEEMKSLVIEIIGSLEQTAKIAVIPKMVELLRRAIKIETITELRTAATNKATQRDKSNEEISSTSSEKGGRGAKHDAMARIAGSIKTPRKSKRLSAAPAGSSSSRNLQKGLHKPVDVEVENTICDSDIAQQENGEPSEMEVSEEESDVEHEEEHKVEEFAEKDLYEKSANSIAVRAQAKEAFLNKMTRNGDRQNDYIKYLKDKINKMNRIMENYYGDYQTMFLKKEDSAKHWCEERLTHEEHQMRFTRQDAAMTYAVKSQWCRDLDTLENGGFTLDGRDYICCTLGQAKFVRNIVKEKEEKDWFCYTRFSLLDIAEKKGREGNLFTKAIEALSHTDKEVFALTGIHKQRRSIKNALNKPGIDLNKIYNELELMKNEDYILPKGKIYCRLLLNVAQLFYYDVKRSEWCCQKINNDWTERTLFKGIPFDKDGKPFHF